MKLTHKKLQEIKDCLDANEIQRYNDYDYRDIAFIMGIIAAVNYLNKENLVPKDFTVELLDK